MLVKEVALQPCRNPDCGTPTNHTLEVLTRGGTLISFPCCLRCRGGLKVRLEDAKQDMDLESALKIGPTRTAAVVEPYDYSDTARKPAYKEIKSIAKREEERLNPPIFNASILAALAEALR